MVKIAIDAGHSSKTAGKRTPPMPFDIDIDKDGKIDIKKGDQLHEHIANVGVASILLFELKRCGIQTMITGFDDDNAYNDDIDLSLAIRQNEIKKGKCDLSISIHFNAFGDGKTFNSANGIGIYIHDTSVGQSQKFANTVMKRLAEGTKQVSRGVTKQSLAMCNCARLGVDAAILVELSFMTNKREATELMASEAFWIECAKEIAKGTCEYLGIKYIEEKPEPTVTYTVQVGAYTVKSNADKLKKELVKLGFEANIIEK